MIVLGEHILEEDKNKFLAVVEKYSGDLALVYALKSLFKGGFLSQASRIALEEGLYTCILNYIKGLKTIPDIKTDEVFLYIRNFLGFVFESATKVTELDKVNKHFESVTLRNTCFYTLKTIKTPVLLKKDDG